jgi:cobalt-zinc-cadmium efflux system protein
MIVFAIFGVIINFLAAYCTKDGDSMNQKSVNLHMLEDVLGWVIVLIGSILMKFTDIVYIDSILSLGVSLFILINSVKLLLSAIDLFLEKTPNGISVAELKEHLLEIEGIISVHDLHIWSLDGVNHCATLHVVVDDHFKSTKRKVREELHEHGIAHVTIEMETESEPCGEEECHLLKTPEHCHHHHHHGHHHHHH